MKKQILVSSLIAAGILGSTGLMAINNQASAEQNTANTTMLAANTANTNLIATKPINTSKNETVYVITDEAGSAKTRFIGSTIYDGAEALPFNFSTTYYLDGQEISGKDLKGKSGHVKIVYHYNSTATYQGKYIPFVAITGLTLNHSKFNNVKISSGKIISETPDSYIIAGYGLAGANQDLGTDFLPDSFTLEADTTDFGLENTYTIFTNDIIADLDTSKLNRLDELTSSVYQLEDGINKLVQGTTDLSNGLATALDGTKQLYDGSKTLAAGAKEIATNTTALSNNLNNLNTNLSEALKNGASDIFDGILATTSSTITAQISQQMPGFSITLTQNDYKTKLDNLIAQIPAYAASFQETKAKLEGVENFCNYLKFYTSSINTMATKTPELAAGAAKLSTGATTLSDGLGSLVEGQAKLYEGSITLKNGLTTFKTAGIDKLVNFASKDLANFTRNARATVTAAGSYKNFGGVDANSVKFIVKTPSI